MGRWMIGLHLVVQLLFVVVSLSGSEPGEKVKVAEGRYRTSMVVGAESGEYVEDWVFHKTAKGYLVESEIKTENPKTGEQFGLLYYFWLDSDLRLVRWEFDSPSEELKPPRRPGCEMNPGKLRCWDAEDEGGDFSVMEPYGMSWVIPMSAWFPMTWIHRSGLGSGGEKARMKVVVWDAADGPDDLIAHDLEIIDLGRERLSTAGREFNAWRIQLVFLPSELDKEDEEALHEVYWLSPEGLVLAWESEGTGWPEGLVGKLVRYEKYGEFGPGVE